MGSRADAWPKERLGGHGRLLRPGRLQAHAANGRKNTSSGIHSKRRLRQAAKRPRTAPGKTEPPKPGSEAEDAAICRGDARRGRWRRCFPTASKIELSPDRDPREVFADWLITPQNPWFTRNIANRVWAWLVGRGIIHEPDDIREDNPPSNPELLAYLEKELIASHYDLKQLYRLILNSETYQLSSVSHARRGGGGSQFRPLPAPPAGRRGADRRGQQDHRHHGPLHEPHSGAVHLHPRQTSRRSLSPTAASPAPSWPCSGGRRGPPAWRTSATTSRCRPSGCTCSIPATSRTSSNRGPKLKAIFESGRKPEEIVEELYLTILSRKPTPAEVQIALEYGRSATPAKPAATKPAAGKPGTPTKPATAKPGTPAKAVTPAKSSAASKPAKPKASPPKRRTDWVDIAWALINSPEFLYRH